MAYGGPAVAPTAPPGGSKTVRQVKLDKECELRVEVSPDSPLRFRLLNGTAEIFGTEIPPEIWLTFPPRLKFAVCRTVFVILIPSHARICEEIDFNDLYMDFVSFSFFYLIIFDKFCTLMLTF